MNSIDWMLIGVILFSFIIGYKLVGFIIQKYYPQEKDTIPNDSQTSQSWGNRNSNDNAWHYSDNFNNEYYAFNKKSQHDDRETPESKNQEIQYANILGLKGKVNSSDVKKAYREMIAKYHPDKVIHLGDEFKNIAELKTVEILKAYTYFRKKYNIK